MIFVLLSMFFGIIIGVIFRKMEKIVKIFNKLSNIIIYFLLFSLGLTVGVNQKIINNITSLGLKAFLISIGAIFGSVIISLPIYIFFFKDKNSD